MWRKVERVCVTLYFSGTIVPELRDLLSGNKQNYNDLTMYQPVI